ncbi:hypothetical protein MLD38_013992 [Melastoma candidum]|uniref:Uncharacterized protein n=1 Tax=Melastoma candidum TaxID=119954 RepID=A0ACB9RBY5_9MYRT|nr:hypothetical protein MLD38_013992 [Melastoma candidum]
MERDSSCRRAECLFPSRIISYLFRRKTTRKPAWQSNAEDRDQVAPPPPPPAVAAHAVVTGNSNKETAVNLGIACSLFYLTATSKKELEKMKELQREMRAFLQEIKAELDREDRAREPGQVMVVGSPRSCLTDAEATLGSSSRRTPFVVAEEESIAGDWPRDSRKTRRDCMRAMEELEAELQAELDRLQLHLDPDSPSKQGPKQHAVEAAFGEIRAEDLDRATSGRTSMSRQEERIKELKTALDWIATNTSSMRKIKSSLGGGTLQ